MDVPDVLAALGDPTRRAIFERLAERPSPVGELARELPVSRPAVSQHLRVLKEARLVADTPVWDPPGVAFRVFYEDMAAWWHPDHHLLSAELATMELEPFVGGHIIDRGVDGSECRWARVLAYDPPHRVVFSWDITLQWRIETDPARTSEVEVRFTPEGDGSTRVELEHRHLERHGEGWEAMRGAVASSKGWPAGLQRFAERVER